jgi:hypothetical protein
MRRWLAKHSALIKSLDHQDAERRRRRTQKIVDQMAASTPECRIAAAKARARAAYAKIDDTNAQTELNSVQNQVPAVPAELDAVRIDDLEALFNMRDQLPVFLQERIKKIHAKIHWQTRKGHRAYFNVAVHENNIPIDRTLTSLAHLCGINDGGNRSLDGWLDSVIECGLFPKVKKGIYKKGRKVGEEHQFNYSRRCQDGEHCNLCNYINISDGLKILTEAYDDIAFCRGGNWFAITVAPRTDPATAKAAGRSLTPADWKFENSDSMVFRESRQGRVFKYHDSYETNESWDWHLESAIRRFLGACQVTFGKLVKNGWLDGIRARVENSFEFLPYASHQHWHGVGSSKFEHDPQKVADFIKTEVDEILARTCPGLYSDVMVAVVPAPPDLQRWIKYMNKTVDVASAIKSVYHRHPRLRRSDEVFGEFYEEFRRYPERTRRVFGLVRGSAHDERGAHTYMLRRRFVRGNHQFGKGSILSESERHREWREAHARFEAGRRARGSSSQTGRAGNRQAQAPERRKIHSGESGGLKAAPKRPVTLA